MKKFLVLTFFTVSSCHSFAQLKWQNVDSIYQPLPAGVHIYFTDTPIDTTPFRAFYLIADISDKRLEFTADTSRDRRLTPSVFYQRNNKPLVVVNCSFFSYETNRSLNTVIMNGKLVAYNQHTIAGRGKDTFTYRHPFVGALGIRKDRTADVAWLYTDSSFKTAFASEKAIVPIKDSSMTISSKKVFSYWFPSTVASYRGSIKHAEWKMETAVGGGPVLVQNGEIAISNNEELKFAGKAINDKHPRTAIGYTRDNKLIILVIEGRNKAAHGATLIQEAQIFKELGCLEALNLDGGGSSCMLVNGKETIKISDAAGQRSVPAVFLIKQR
jgi:exopolysaccharide biosynthesis protein